METATEVTLIEEIKAEYAKIKSKGVFIVSLAKELGKSTNTIRNHWLSVYSAVPEEHQELVLSMLKDAVKNQQTA